MFAQRTHSASYFPVMTGHTIMKFLVYTREGLKLNATLLFSQPNAAGL
jgi:hypothetical protein